MWSLLFNQAGQPFDLYSVAVDCIGRCTCSRHIVLSVHCFLVVILFELWWHLFAMPLPLGICTHHSLSWIPHSPRKHSTCLLSKVVSLSVRISTGGPHSQNTDWRITLEKSCHSNSQQTRNLLGPQSISVRKY